MMIYKNLKLLLWDYKAHIYKDKAWEKAVC